MISLGTEINSPVIGALRFGASLYPKSNDDSDMLTLLAKFKEDEGPKTIFLTFILVIIPSEFDCIFTLTTSTLLFQLSFLVCQ